MKNNIAKLRRAANLSMEALGEAIGTTASTINKLEKGGMRLSDRWIMPIAEALNVKPADLIQETDAAPTREKPAEQNSMIPVFGLAAGAITGTLALSDEPIEYMPATPAVARVKGAYGLYVTGESMVPRFYPGEPIVINPHRPVRQGDFVVVQERRNGGTHVSLKQFERLTETHLVTKQFNPSTNIEFVRSQIVHIHRIMTLAEVMGA